MLLYSRTEEKTTIKPAEMTVGVRAVANAAPAALQALAVLLATATRGSTGLPLLLSALPLPCWLFLGWYHVTSDSILP